MRSVFTIKVLTASWCLCQPTTLCWPTDFKVSQTVYVNSWELRVQCLGNLVFSLISFGFSNLPIVNVTTGL